MADNTVTQTTERRRPGDRSHCENCSGLASWRTVRTDANTRRIIMSCNGHVAATRMHDTES